MKTSIALLLTMVLSHLHGQTTIYPGGPEGDSASAYPFNSTTGARYQQVYSGAALDFHPGGAWITDIVFRLDSGAGRSFGTTLQDIQINLSTTPAGEGSLSPVFVGNVGANDTIVFDRGSMRISGIWSPGTSPQQFAIVLSLPRPFFYNPAEGNLLLDIRDFSGNGPDIPPFDATSNIDGVGRVFASDVNALSGSADVTGLMTAFNFSTVPEPSTVSLVGFGVVVLGVIKFRQRRKRRNYAAD